MRLQNGDLGKRFIGCGKQCGVIKLNDVPGNALGAYLNGGEIEVFSNVQDATGDTMNSGVITVHGSAGDCTGYAMRGGEIYVRDDAGYRTGIHMKEYRDKVPVIVIGGACGSFLGEYQAGGTILVLGIGHEGSQTVGYFCGTGMHGGRIYLRTEHLPRDLPAQVRAAAADEEDLRAVAPLVSRYCEKFGGDAQALLNSRFFVLTPNSSNPYRELYVNN